jgi:hypothetical protein
VVSRRVILVGQRLVSRPLVVLRTKGCVPGAPSMCSDTTTGITGFDIGRV